MKLTKSERVELTKQASSRRVRAEDARRARCLGGLFEEIQIRSEAEDSIPLRTSCLLEKPCFLQSHDCTRSGVVRNPELPLRGLNVRQRMTEQKLKQLQLV